MCCVLLAAFVSLPDIYLHSNIPWGFGNLGHVTSSYVVLRLIPCYSACWQASHCVLFTQGCCSSQRCLHYHLCHRGPWQLRTVGSFCLVISVRVSGPSAPAQPQGIQGGHRGLSAEIRCTLGSEKFLSPWSFIVTVICRLRYGVQ